MPWNSIGYFKPKPKDYEELVLKLSKHLDGWQIKFLNSTGRATLVKSILSSLPVYHMQTSLLPNKTSKSMEQIMRRVLWDKNGQGKYFAQIGWQTSCT